MPATRLRPLLAGAAATALAVTVAGCGADDESSEGAATPPAAATADGPATEGTTEADGAAAAGPGDAAAYRDGDYEADGSYQSPGGRETVGVALTLQGGTVTKLTVTSKAKHPNSKNFQGRFISGIEAEVVGRPIDELDVDKVAGSSLTSGGFNEAIDAIKAEAAG